MDTLNIVLFVITFGFVLLSGLFYISLWADRTISWPPIIPTKWAEPGRWYFLYPSMFYQIWFWFSLYNFFG